MEMLSTLPALCEENPPVTGGLCLQKAGNLDFDLFLNTWCILKHTQIAKFMGPTWVPPGSCRPQMGAMLVHWTLLSGHG